MGVKQEDIDKLRAQGLTHFANLLESVKTDPTVVVPVVKPLSEGDISELFEGQQIDAAVVDKAKAIFESAVEKRVIERMKAVDEQLEPLREAFKAEQEKSVNLYLEGVVSNWLKENELKVFDAAIVEQAKTFLTKGKAMFESFGIDLEDGNTIKTAIKESTETIEMLENQVLVFKIKETISNAKAGLSEAQAASFDSIVGEMEFTSIEDLEKVTPTIIESVTKTEDDVDAAKALAEAEAAKALAEAEAAKAAKQKSVDPLMEAVMKHLKKSI